MSKLSEVRPTECALPHGRKKKKIARSLAALRTSERARVTRPFGNSSGFLRTFRDDDSRLSPSGTFHEKSLVLCTIAVYTLYTRYSIYKRSVVKPYYGSIEDFQHVRHVQLSRGEVLRLFFLFFFFWVYVTRDEIRLDRGWKMML